MLDRRDVLGALFPDPGAYLMVAGLAGSARDAAALTDEADTLFAFGGAMGGAVPMGLGMALAAPDRKIAVVTGDGELLMNAGALASVASTMPENLSIVCIDNGRHGETGGQLGHTARRTDLARMAEGAGLPSAMTVTDAAGLGEAAAFLQEAPGAFIALNAGHDDQENYYNHHPQFNPNEDCLQFGVEAFVKIIMAQDNLIL